MKSVLEQMYHGDLYPYSKFKTTIEEFQKDRDKAFHSYTTFLEKLPPELQEEFEQLMDEHIHLLPQEMEQNFIDGFKIGARLMAEVYGKNS